MNIQNIEKELRNWFRFGFHLRRRTWDWLELDNLIAELGASKDTVGVYTLRQVADRFNKKRTSGSMVHEPVQAGQLVSVGIIVDVLRYVIGLYSTDENPGSMTQGLAWSANLLGAGVRKIPPVSFVALFPPDEVVLKSVSPDDFLAGKGSEKTPEETSAAEMILLSLSMSNRAFVPFRELFDDAELKVRSPYEPLVGSLESFFATQPIFGPLGKPLFECLRAPMLAFPDSLEGQLEYIRQHWSQFLPADLLERIHLASDVLREERTLRGIGPGPNEVLHFMQREYGSRKDYPEPAAFSRDADWMSNVVLIAKSIYVWLDQLSAEYGRSIVHLNDIPDEALDRLASWGFSGLWLIGVWERSVASQTIKQVMGNPEAAASAYSLYDYNIAADLGGDEAYRNLAERAWKRGIRLASDMVPNHMGIFSRWVIEHPDWFVQSPHPPFPCYQFTGVNLSHDDRATIQIEDGYWDHRDAAVVFKRIDNATGEVRYIYHGNDGTSMPWNDTAQLNFMMAEVREAVIQTILHVARRFPIIRFDAAMTLAKKHYQRLWFPQPGDGGAIPSRAEHGMSRDEFDAIFPKEFWREVVDRVAAEVPETLLLAEAFWLMEGYFVRTLGMHRVYNSAFMNMLKMEENSKYRQTVKNVLEFSPEVLKRFVNFMNNPDERTAVEQFGKGDKYYGVSVMMVTMPGLPMFGHGQIEGYTEKYGMEYRKAYWNEEADRHMIYRHEREVFPLMKRRHLFSGADNFALYDFVTPDGWVDENVFAYSNRSGNERAIVLYNNAYSTTRGKITRSTAINVGGDDNTHLVQKSLAEALAINVSPGVLYRFRDHQSDKEYLRFGLQIAEEGVFAELHAYQYHVFLDFREIHDSDGTWSELCNRLNGAGVPDIDIAHREMMLEPVLNPFRAVVDPGHMRGFCENAPWFEESFAEKLRQFTAAIEHYTGISAAESAIDDTTQLLNAIHSLASERVEIEPAEGVDAEDTDEATDEVEESRPDTCVGVLYAWAVITHIERVTRESESAEEYSAVAVMDAWLLPGAVQYACTTLTDNAEQGYADRLLVETLVRFTHDLDVKAIRPVLVNALEDSIAREFLEVHEHEGTVWFSKEKFESLVSLLEVLSLVMAETAGTLTDESAEQLAAEVYDLIETADDSGYRLEIFETRLKP